MCSVFRVGQDLVKGSDGFEPPKYLSSLISTVNDGAKAAQAGALVGLYLLASAFSATDEDLLRGRTVTISQIGATLPVSFSFAVAPCLPAHLQASALRHARRECKAVSRRAVANRTVGT